MNFLGNKERKKAANAIKDLKLKKASVFVSSSSSLFLLRRGAKKEGFRYKESN